ncbi:MAG: MBL fold metallo-hydrolase [Candidatus Latescibacteria bacterium]|jgi:Cft2 family RNA processing exonuclease|nr:MBL fold metallo-hydrolase [Candidatus Latescibacterota bacterium]
MDLHFLGGADEIGASCTWVDIEGHHILVDAGIRMGASQGSNLPNLSFLDEVGSPEEVLLTHAHTDHTGALPVLGSGLAAGVPIRCTDPTRAITRVLLADALKIMDSRGEQDGELPLYPPEAVDACLARMSPAPFLSSVPICGGALHATWIPAGHILGAACVYIEGSSESLLISGDVSVSHQLTIPGMVVPQCRPDVVVMESTYGNRQHADRKQQEAALAHRVAEAVDGGGKVLVPAFAVGRAQEVLLILSGAMRRKEIPPFPVFVDGMVRSVNALYAGFPEALAPNLRRRLERGEDPFCADHVSVVAKPADREAVVSGPPCCIVASSGMLVGGASSAYAQRLASGPENLIAITGYQDEESPGRALLDLAREREASERVLTLNGQRLQVACRVETYSLSAHADSGELTALVNRLSPRTVYLVHGDREARGSLASSLDLHLEGGVHLAENGVRYTVELDSGRRRRRYGRLVSVQGVSRGRPVSADALHDLSAYVQTSGLKGPLRVQELAEIWYGTEATAPERLEDFRDLLQGDQTAFVPDHRRPYLYRVAEKSEEVGGPLEMNAARERIQAAFPPEAGLYRCSAFVEDGAYELAFHFPDVVRERHADDIRRLEEETGWQIRLRETAHQARLFEEASASLPEGVSAARAPALRLERREVALEVAVSPDLCADWDGLAEEAADRFLSTTGYTLRLIRPDQDTATPASPEVLENAWEINRAYAEVREAFRSESHAPYRIGLKTDAAGSYIEAAFVSPAVGERYADLLGALSERVGWILRVRDSVNQEQIAQEARSLTPEDCTLRGAPRLFAAQGRVVVPVQRAPSEQDQTALREAFRDATGLEIEWEAPKQMG